MKLWDWFTQKKFIPETPPLIVSDEATPKVQPVYKTK